MGDNIGSADANGAEFVLANVAIDHIFLARRRVEKPLPARAHDVGLAERGAERGTEADLGRIQRDVPERASNLFREHGQSLLLCRRGGRRDERRRRHPRLVGARRPVGSLVLMPELPEVETVRRVLDERFRGRTIEAVAVGRSVSFIPRGWYAWIVLQSW